MYRVGCVTTNGNSGNGDGKPTGKWNRFGHEVGAFWGGELLASAVLPGAIWIEETIDRYVPGPINFTTKILGKCLEPVIEPLEKGLSFICRLESCQPDLTKTPEERAQKLARAICIAVPPLALTYWAKLTSRRWLEDKLKVPGMVHSGRRWLPIPRNAKEWMVVLTDEGAHTLFMGAVGGPYAKQADDAVDYLQSIFVKAGMSKQTAHDVALTLVLHEGPNIAAGGTATIGMALRRMFHGPNGNGHT
jgi:hypothetical protein